MHGGERAFTIVELLVVVTIIAILIALLVPALAVTGEMGRAVKCLSNQRQMVIAATAPLPRVPPRIIH